MGNFSKLKRGAIWFLIFIIGLSNLAALVTSPKTIKAAESEPIFDFSKETWVKSAADNKIVHTVPYTLSGESKIYTRTYGGHPVGGRAYRRVAPLANIDWWGTTYQLEGSSVYELLTSEGKNDQQQNSFQTIVEGLYANVNSADFNTICNPVPYTPNLAFWWGEREPDNDTPSRCFEPASGGTDSLYAWYIKKTSQHLKDLHTTGDLYSGPCKNCPKLKFETVSTPQDCQDLFLAAPLGDKADKLFQEMDPNHKLFDGKSPVTKDEDAQLYSMFYRTSGNTANYSDVHFDEEGAWRNFISVYTEAEQGLSSYWQDVATERGESEKNALMTTAAGYGAKRVGAWLINVGLQGSGTWSYGALAAGQGTAALFGPLIVAAGTVAVAGEGIAMWKSAQNEEYRHKLAKLIHAAFYIPAHIAFHECMADNNVPGFTKEKLETEKKLWADANQLINAEIQGFFRAEAQASGQGSCLVGGKWYEIGNPLYWIEKALCAVLEMIAFIAKWLTDHLFLTVFTAYNFHSSSHNTLAFLSPFSISKVRAADDSVSSLIDALTIGKGTWPWVIDSWKWCIGLMDLFLVVILLFIGIVNILHIQYDTYQLKKALPLIIVGVILANFSLLIMRMLLDASNILSKSFMGGDPGKMVSDLINAVDINKNSVFRLDNIGILLVAIVFGIFAMAAFLILGFMFYARYATIILLAIVAPLAFICMAFPPTQSIFKQWWSWTTKFVFMKPIAFFLLFIALKVKETTSPDGGATTSLTGFIIITFLVYMAILVPWKLGGAVMAFWGGVGGTIFGTKKGGWARKPAEEWWQRRKDKAGAFVKTKMPGLFAGAEADRKTTEALKKTAQSKVEGRAREAHPEITAWEGRAKTEENKLKGLVEKQADDYEKGAFKMSWWLRLMSGGVKWEGGRPKIKTEKDLQQDSVYSSAELILLTKLHEANNKDATSIAAAEIGRENNELSLQLAALANKGITLPGFQVGRGGKLEEAWDEVVVDPESGEGTWDAERREYIKRVRRRGDIRGTMDMVSQLRQRAGIVSRTDPEAAGNLEASANELEQMIRQFQAENQEVEVEIDGKKVRQKIKWDAYMDKTYAGRVLSAVTPWALEDVSTNLLNENPQGRLDRSKEGFGNRDVRVMADAEGTLNDFVTGKRSKLNVVDAIASGVFMMEWVQAMERGGKKNRAMDLYNFLQRFDGGGKGLWERGALLQKLLGREQRLTPGIAQGFLAEQMVNAARRGGEVPGIEMDDVLRSNLAGGGAAAKTAAVEHIKNHMPDPSAILQAHPEIFAQVDLTSRGALTMDTMAIFNGLTDSISEMRIFTGGGNPVTQMIQATDISAEDRFRELDEPVNMERRLVKERERQARDTAVEEFPTLDERRISDAAAHDGAERTYQRYAPAVEEYESQRSLYSDQIRIGGRPLTAANFSQIGQAIARSVATSVGSLQDELRASLDMPDLDISGLGLDSDAAVQTLREGMGRLIQGLQNAEVLKREVEASEVCSHTPRQEPGGGLPSTIQIEQSLGRLESALDTFSSTMQRMTAEGRGGQQVPENIMRQVMGAINEAGNVLPLTQDTLKSSPAQLAELLQKMTIGLRAMKGLDPGQRGDQQLLLQAIKTELQRMNRNLGGGTGAAGRPGSEGAQTQGGAEETPPYTPDEEMPPET